MSRFKKSIEKKVKSYSKKLGVGDYAFHVNVARRKHSKDKYDTYGFVMIDEETREVVMTVNEGLLKKQPYEINNTVVHELLHVRLSELLTFMGVILETYVKDKKARNAYNRQIAQLEHKIIIAVTDALVRK